VLQVIIALAVICFLVFPSQTPIGKVQITESDCWNKNGNVQRLACNQIIASNLLHGRPIEKNDLAIILSNRGTGYAEYGQFEKVIADYTKAVQLNPEGSHFFFNRANTFRDLGKFDLAIEDYNKAIQTNPRHSAAYSNRGLTFQQNGQREKAIRDYFKALEIDPSLKQAKENLISLGIKGKREV